MLKGIHPVLTGELLLQLDRLGHGDTLVVADANFPAHRVGSTVIELPGLSAPAVLAAIETVLPLDEYGGPCLMLMSAEDDPRHATGGLLPVQEELAAAAGVEAATLERFAFYDAAASAGLVVRTGELRAYGNAILRKGVVTGTAATVKEATS